MIRPIYQIKLSKRYKKDIKRLSKSHYNMTRLEDVVDQLLCGMRLSDEYGDHELHGKLKGTRECHIGPDWLLRYTKDGDHLLLLLISTGTHRHVLGIE